MKSSKEGFGGRFRGDLGWIVGVGSLSGLGGGIGAGGRGKDRKDCRYPRSPDARDRGHPGLVVRENGNRRSFGCAQDDRFCLGAGGPGKEDNGL
jgi:hypothetical protein